MDKIINQLIICIFIIFTIIISGEIDNVYVEKGREEVLDAISKNYTEEEIIDISHDIVSFIKNIPIVVSDAVVSANASFRYGEPIDKIIKTNESMPIFSVGGGTVVTVGENVKNGKYIIISHGNEAESVYGNLETISVSSMQRVKKGEIIATYNSNCDRDFYYDFSYL